MRRRGTKNEISAGCIILLPLSSLQVSSFSNYDATPSLFFDCAVSNVDGSKTVQRKEDNTDGDNFFKPLATMAVVSLGLCIEGDSLSTGIAKQVRDREDVRKALSQIATDVQTEECLLSAEVLWTPEEDTDILSEEDIYADYPDLYPLLD